jgi:hypothetical protein
VTRRGGGGLPVEDVGGALVASGVNVEVWNTAERQSVRADMRGKDSRRES